jgi:hypothetical protein
MGFENIYLRKTFMVIIMIDTQNAREARIRSAFTINFRKNAIEEYSFLRKEPAGTSVVIPP